MPISNMFGSFLPNLWSSTNQSLLASREPTLLCNHLEVTVNPTPLWAILRSTSRGTKMSTLRKTFYALTIVGLFGVFVAGCGGGSYGTNPPPPPNAHEGLFTDTAPGIQALSIDSSGMLTALASTPDSDLSPFIPPNTPPPPPANSLALPASAPPTPQAS